MDINAFKTFIEVAKTRHFGRAAENLCVSQSAVSARIRALEESLGTSLFVRERSNVHLSPEGEALLAHAKVIVGTWNKVRLEAGVPNGIATRIVVGGLPGLWDITLQGWLNRIFDAEQDLLINADIQSASTLANQVINGSMDIAFVYDAPQSEFLVTVPLKEISLRLVTSMANSDLSSALSDGYISVYWGTYVGIQQAEQFPDLPVSKLQTSLGRIALEFLKNNAGSAYLAEPAIQDLVKSKVLHYVKGAPVFKRRAYAIFHKDSSKIKLLRRLLEYLDM